MGIWQISKNVCFLTKKKIIKIKYNFCYLDSNLGELAKGVLTVPFKT